MRSLAWSAFSQSCQATNPSPRIGRAVTSAVMNLSSDSFATGSTSSRFGTTSAAADTQILLVDEWAPDPEAHDRAQSNPGAPPCDPPIGPFSACFQVVRPGVLRLV